jgi:nitrate/TMAO reductase-like tetraheme cytochrome c subunit
VQSDLTGDSTHARASLAGNENAAVCVDCHGSHNVRNPAESRPEISRTCGQCHSAIFTIYSQSVHGAALLDEGNPDVPTCIDCHGVHNIQDPTTNLFRLRSPLLCASCHANEELMSQYGISTNVFDSYVSDFHGTTVTLFEQEDPNAAVNKAVCYDCHGVHDIKAPTDAESSVLKDNLLQTCRKCHPDATADFASAWMGHYEPSPERYPLVYFVDQFYKYFIPGVVGFMVLVILTDIYRRVRMGIRRGRPGGGES